MTKISPVQVIQADRRGLDRGQREGSEPHLELATRRNRALLWNAHILTVSIHNPGRLAHRPHRSDRRYGWVLAGRPDNPHFIGRTHAASGRVDSRSGLRDEPWLGRDQGRSWVDKYEISGMSTPRTAPG